MSDLPVREMVLYKHGVGFFRREGKVGAEEVALTFRQDEINDVLKSLAVFDREGGQILGIHYQTPMDKQARLADSSIRLSDEASLCDLLRDLRGRRVELYLAEEAVSGRLIGVDLEKEETSERSLVSIVSDIDGQVRVNQLRRLRGVRILDDRAAHDLLYFLDTSLDEDVRRTVTLRLSPGRHDLVVYYVAPSPTWRVSYRLVAESDEGGESGKALLQGWGLFDNRLDEDLENVSVTLVAGQPISFIYDLYASHIPMRPTVRDEARVAPGPVEFEGVAAKRALREERLSADTGAPVPMAAPAMHAAGRPEVLGLAYEEMAQAAPPAAQAREAGEFFQYIVTTPVSVKRGESALVPIIGAEVGYNRELLYNGTKLPNHPVAALRFDNITSLTLERGPVTVVVDGEYKGEAVVPFTGADNEVYLAYAVELGVRVTERGRPGSTEMAGLNIREGYLIIQEYYSQTTIYIMENTTDRDLTITIEAPILAGHELFDTAEPDVVTANERRWRVFTPAHNTTEFVRRERRLLTRREEVRKMDYRRLQKYLAERWLDQDVFDRLAGILENLEFIQDAHTEQEQLRGERGTIYERQAQLRENLNALKPAGEEGMLRTRMLRQLEATENRLEEIDTRLSELETLIEETEARIELALVELNREGSAE